MLMASPDSQRSKSVANRAAGHFFNQFIVAKFAALRRGFCRQTRRVPACRITWRLGLCCAVFGTHKTMSQLGLTRIAGWHTWQSNRRLTGRRSQQYCY